MPYFRSNAMNGTCIGAYLELIDSRKYPPTPENLVNELSGYVGSTKIPVIVTLSHEEPFRKVLSETGFITYKGKNGSNVHCVDPVVLRKIRLAEFKPQLDAIERGKAGQLSVGDRALFGSNFENAVTSHINLNGKRELIGVRIEEMEGNRVKAFYGFLHEHPFTYRDIYGWGREHFSRMVFE